jgi:hypothetical protein
VDYLCYIWRAKVDQHHEQLDPARYSEITQQRAIECTGCGNVSLRPRAGRG